jgi:hypothetical protein
MRSLKSPLLQTRNPTEFDHQYITVKLQLRSFDVTRGFRPWNPTQRKKNRSLLSAFSSDESSSNLLHHAEGFIVVRMLDADADIVLGIAK